MCYCHPEHLFSIDLFIYSMFVNIKLNQRRLQADPHQWIAGANTASYFRKQLYILSCQKGHHYWDNSIKKRLPVQKVRGSVAYLVIYSILPNLLRSLLLESKLQLYQYNGHHPSKRRWWQLDHRRSLSMHGCCPRNRATSRKLFKTFF